MTKISRPKADYLKARTGIAAGSRNGKADEYEEEYDEIESFPFDAEHDEDDRDPEPERRPYSEHAQERRRANRASRRDDKSRV
ncbi:hypothetical protein EDC30_11068 [Paucimonas lemoignei]|uniref:Uncharacterized protein n=1 Tax=Paucimonas lemoignei TaxID=29443 RepID=A0A4V2UIC4_PAULE|nr:hypothetical protein [Paucimonas lemoignei]TCS35600.1 hypothetical protein EDC30_11068 [Paucimonas lemoignei]